MSESEILLRACEIWMEREKAKMKKTLEWERSQPEFQDYFPPYVDIDKLAEKVLEDDSIIYTWLKCERKKLLKNADAQ